MPAVVLKIVATSDVMAMTTVSTLHRLGKRVPCDVMVVGYGSIVLSSHCRPALTTIRQAVQAAGEDQDRTLLERLRRALTEIGAPADRAWHARVFLPRRTERHRSRALAGGLQAPPH